jgi:hypothetical protein
MKHRTPRTLALCTLALVAIGATGCTINQSHAYAAPAGLYRAANSNTPQFWTRAPRRSSFADLPVFSLPMASGDQLGRRIDQVATVARARAKMPAGVPGTGFATVPVSNGN